jgi:predicted enzyme related to lactoylglutathione lyase
MILGLRTALYPAPDLAKSTAFYEKVLGIAPYFDEPFYVGFAASGFELGLVPDAKSSKEGVLAYWGVANVDEELARLEKLGATVHEKAHDVGGGIRVASILDPAGNRFGLIENPHFDAKTVK